MGNLQVRFLEGWAPAMAPGHSTLTGLRKVCPSSAPYGNLFNLAIFMSSEAPFVTQSEEGWRSVGRLLSKLKTISLPFSRSAHQRNHPDSMRASRSSAQPDILEKNCTARI